MAREKKCRRICFQPNNKFFVPNKSCGENITLTLEECEALRLVDHEGMDQNQASLRMDISRGTFQRILYSARYKLSDAILFGKEIIIFGGDYEFASTTCNCHKRCDLCRFDLETQDNKGDNDNDTTK